MTFPLDFPRSAQSMILYFAEERCDPTCWYNWKKYEAAVEQHWPEFYAAWKDLESDYTNEGFNKYMKIVVEHRIRLQEQRRSLVRTNISK